MKRLVWTWLALLVLGCPVWGQPAPAPVTPPPSGEPGPMPAPSTDPGATPIKPAVPILPSTPIEDVDPFDSCGCSGGCCNLAHPWRRNNRAFASNCAACDAFVCGPEGKVWVNVDYLYWRLNGDRLPPLVTTSPVGTAPADAGVLPDAATLFGDSPFNNEFRSGMRFGVGTWFNASQTIGFQVGGFFLQDRTATAEFGSLGAPILARPFINTDTGTSQSVLIAYPGISAGGINISERNTFSGFDFALRGTACCGENWRLDTLLGYRYLKFTEQLQINSRVTSTGAVPPAGTVIENFDRFDTGARFQGVQAGLTGEVRFHQNWSLSGTAKASVGMTDLGVGIDGATSITSPTGAVTQGVGGFLALNSNLGVYRNNEASLVPELNLALGYQPRDNVRVRIGYDFLYFPNVQRPGRAIDLQIDPARIPPLGIPRQDRPFFSFNLDDLVVQGASFSIEVRY